MLWKNEADPPRPGLAARTGLRAGTCACTPQGHDGQYACTRTEAGRVVERYTAASEMDKRRFLRKCPARASA